MWIVKLGGSLLDAAELPRWLRAVATAPMPVLVVPGGGPFADAVRTAQARLGFGDRAAHRMAILAMQQTALALADLEPRLRTVERPGPGAAPAAIWLPWPMLADEPSLPASWQVTSDSLSCWLATRLRADGLLLVKSAPLEDRSLGLDDLVAGGVVDAAFAGFAAAFAGPIRMAGRAAIVAAGFDPARLGRPIR